MSSGALPLLARLGEAASFPKAVREYESDPWSYLRRKLGECEAPLRDYKNVLLRAAAERLVDDLRGSFLRPGSLMDHKETFEKLLPPGDFADLSFHLEPGGDPAARREAVLEVLRHAKVRTVYDVEALPPERRGKAWEAQVGDAARRLDLDRLGEIIKRAPMTERRRAYAARRARRGLAEFLAVTHGEAGMRDEITPFVLFRLETVVAALLRLFAA